MSDASIQARAKQDQIESNKEYVREQLTKMKEQCAVCKLSTCDGTIAKCLTKTVGIIAIAVIHIVVAITIIKIAQHDE